MGDFELNTFGRRENDAFPKTARMPCFCFVFLSLKIGVFSKQKPKQNTQRLSHFEKSASLVVRQVCLVVFSLVVVVFFFPLYSISNSQMIHPQLLCCLVLFLFFFDVLFLFFVFVVGVVYLPWWCVSPSGCGNYFLASCKYISGTCPNHITCLGTKGKECGQSKRYRRIPFRHYDVQKDPFDHETATAGYFQLGVTEPSGHLETT
mmetsp:Transcript_68601/g.79936  ORF Transcript_68601/g.79936 Transcript_68601/m.79936 type:complete len:205 (-) Transcript_68601:366-980(-)